MDAFCLLSALSGVVFLLSAAFSLARLTGEDLPSLGLMLLAFQEVWTSAFYANSNILAAAFLFSGFLVAVHGKTVRSLLLAGVLLGLSVWMRFDAVLMFPVLPLLICGKSWREIGLKTVLIGSLAAVIVLITLYLSNVSLSDILISSQRHFQLRAAATPGLGIPWLGDSNVKSHLAYFSLFILALLGLGLVHTLASKNWKALAVFSLGTLPLYLTYLGDLTTPKYLLYATPFFAFLAMRGWRYILECSNKGHLAWMALLILLFIGQYGLGLRIRFVSKPYYYSADPTMASLFRVQLSFKSMDELSLVIGAGARISTVDRDRLFSGLVYAPLMWHTQKVQLNVALSQLAEQLDQSQPQPMVVVVDEDDPLQQVLIFLFSLGYGCEQSSLRERYVYSCQQGSGQRVILMDIRENLPRQAAVFEENLAEAHVQHFFFVVTAPWQEYLIDQHFLSHPNWQVKKLNFLVYEFSSSIAP